jgi:aspartate 1-decarboxylase
MKSKIHRATVTDADLDYVGSITVDGFEPIVVHVDSENRQVDVSPGFEGVPALREER